MRTTSSIQFFCRKSKANKQGYSPLECSVTLSGVRKFLNLPMKFRPDEFNKKKPSPEIVEALDLWRNRINDYTIQMMRERMVITPQTLREVIQQGGVRTMTVGKLFDDYLSLLKKRIGVDLTQSSWRKYEIVAEKVLKYVHRDDDVTILTPNLIQTICADMRAVYDPATASGYMTRMKTFTRYVLDNGHLKINPFQGIKITKPIKPIKALTEDEVNKLLTLSLEPRLQRVLDLFLIQCGTGMAYTDLMDFTADDLKQEDSYYYISKPRNKTGKTFTALVFPWAVPIILHYRKPYKISNQKFNKFLKEIDPRITTHMGRRTYATMLVNKGVDINTVAAALGDNPQIAARYYAKVFDRTIIQNTIQSLTNPNLNPQKP